MKGELVALALVLSFLCALGLTKSAEVTVTTPFGSVIGISNGTIGSAEFLGIPFAQPPIGGNRWKAPKPWEPSGSSVTLNATRYAPTCQQFDYQDLVISEDCLYLNVFAPLSASPNSRLAVMVLPRLYSRFACISPNIFIQVFVHGGSFLGGSSTVYPLAKLAYESNLVCVTFNYRLGVFGFLASKVPCTYLL